MVNGYYQFWAILDGWRNSKEPCNLFPICCSLHSVAYINFLFPPNICPRTFFFYAFIIILLLCFQQYTKYKYCPAQPWWYSEKCNDKKCFCPQNIILFITNLHWHEKCERKFVVKKFFFSVLLSSLLSFVTNKRGNVMRKVEYVTFWLIWDSFSSRFVHGAAFCT